jgi:L-arabinokinase
MKTIAYYITAHGYGHGARSCNILSALRATAPDVRILVKTDLPARFMESRLPDSIEIRPGAFDVGLIQKDSIQADIEASLTALEHLYSREEELITGECDFLKQEHAGVVVSDIPAIPLAAAQRAGIPNIATSNFGWDWIYSEFAEKNPRWNFFVNTFRTVYTRTDLLLRQPFAEPMKAFSKQVDLPLLAGRGTACREKIAKATGADPEKEWILLSFTALNLNREALNRLSKLDAYELFTVEPLKWRNSNIHCLSHSLASFVDILESCDTVISKPGFGIVSECIAADKPLIYSDRENFLEYPILVDAIERYCRQAFIPNSDLYSGNIERALGEIRKSSPPPETIERGGAEKAADLILSHLK